MANVKSEQERAVFHSRVLHAAAKLFLEKGYEQSSTREIAEMAGVHVSAMNRAFGSKEHILCELVGFLLDGQFSAAKKMLAGVTEDPVLYYAAETTLQLYLAESDEAIRSLYAAAYSMPSSATLIHSAVTEKLVQVIFREYLPDFETKDFFELELASGGIIRGYMTVPCDMYFTMDRKVRRFLETSLRVYKIPEEKIEEAIAFVGQFDYPAIAKQTVEDMFAYLEGKL